MEKLNEKEQLLGFKVNNGLVFVGDGEVTGWSVPRAADMRKADKVIEDLLCQLKELREREINWEVIYRECDKGFTGMTANELAVFEQVRDLVTKQLAVSGEGGRE